MPKTSLMTLPHIKQSIYNLGERGCENPEVSMIERNSRRERESHPDANMLLVC
jgi:hypothetical protein